MKIIFAALALIAIVALIGCASKVTTTQTTPPAQGSASNDVGSALDSQFNYNDPLSSSAADTFSDQDLAIATG